MKKAHCFVFLFLLMSALPSGIIFAQEKAPSGLNIECCFPAQVAIGKDSRVVVISNAFTAISAVTINPTGNITVKKINQIDISEYDRKQGKKRWEVILFADKKAKLGARILVLQTPEGLSQEKTINVIPYVPEITGVRILSTEKEKWVVNFTLNVNYPGKALGKKSKLNIQMICGTDAIFTIRDVKKAINKGKGKWEVQGMVDNPGFNAFCENPAEISVSLADDNEYQGDYFTHKFEFK
jgi:hypothetical protein